ncbi:MULTISPECIES: beta-ketoacyl-ACP synthase II [Marinilabiliaceae]|uniref:3-oxoacyl-[acyl-carrier-protein] synthase 2 n=1 Tax=Plebeiibacterium marinum TaxID=2992111 RepID=A0AAE3SKS0_9BACT|nr:beta-ketoacyl-ACP synthase II [Plebeiobacterium marinum]MCU4164352.1 beta-ketoacyl-ACP synthase II [Marinilabiliaceae bacterium A049]MCW3806694.1 beta-ketoacyl-ACP synthase II [Plebeiobacterium marinum]
MKRVVVTGMGALTPIGNNVNDFWNNLIKGKNGISKITRFDASNLKTQIAAEVKNFDPLQYLEKAEVRKQDAFVHYAIAVMEECLADAKIQLDETDLKRTGVIWGSGIGGIKTFEDEVTSFNRNPEISRFSPFFITKLISNMAAGYISIRYGLKGVSYVTTSACASSNNAIIDAFNLIRLGKANAIFAGGSEACVTQSGIGGFSSMRAISARNDSPETASRPFDKTRDGFVMGEGAGVLLLEELEHAKQRGAKIYCELAGGGFSSDAYHIAAPHPEGEGAVTAMLDAINEAGLAPSDIDYISAHGTSTPVGDLSECKAICNVFSNNLESLHVSANKSMIGHLLGAAGAVEAVACVMAIKEGVVPPTMNLNETDPDIDNALNLTPNKAVNKEINTALNNTFGFGGHIFTSLFKRFI